MKADKYLFLRRCLITTQVTQNNDGKLIQCDAFNLQCISLYYDVLSGVQELTTTAGSLPTFSSLFVFFKTSLPAKSQKTRRTNELSVKI